MKRINVAVLCMLVLLCLFASCKSFGNDRSVTIKNTTEKDIAIVKLSTSSSPTLPVNIPAGEEKVLQWERTSAETETFVVKCDGKSYQGDTGYSQGSAKYTITFSMDGGSLASQTLYSGLADGLSQTKPVSLKLIEQQ